MVLVSLNVRKLTFESSTTKIAVPLNDLNLNKNFKSVCDLVDESTLNWYACSSLLYYILKGCWKTQRTKLKVVSSNPGEGKHFSYKSLKYCVSCSYASQ